MYQFLAKSILIFSGFIAGFLILEAGVRLLPEPLPPRLYQFIEPDSQIGTIYKKNLDTYIEAEDGNGIVPFRTNSRGFVGPDWDTKKVGIRIANYGDSFTAGSAVSYEKNYVSILGDTLSNLIGTSVESINFGVVGQGTNDALETYRHYGTEADEDVVFLWVYIGNDFYDNLENSTVPDDKVIAEVNEKKTEQEAPFMVRLLKKSELLFFIKDRIAEAPWGHRFFLALSKIPGMERFIYRLTLAEYPPQIPLDLLLLFTDHEKNAIVVEETKKYIKKFSEESAKNGARFFIVLVPTHFQVDHEAELVLHRQYPELLRRGFNILEPNRILGEALKELKISYLDLTSAFTDEYKKGHSFYICDFCHLNEDGHRFAGNRAAEWLAKNYNKNL